MKAFSDLNLIKIFLGANLTDCLEEDEKTVDAAIEDGVFQFLKTLIVKSSIFHEQV